MAAVGRVKRDFAVLPILMGGGLTLSLLFFLIGLSFGDPYIALAGVLVLYCFNIVYGCRNHERCALFLFLHFGIFLFWLSRPFIALFYGTDDWQGSTPDSTFFALGSIYLTMFFLVAGTELYALAGDEERRAPLLPRWRFRVLGDRPLRFEKHPHAVAKSIDRDSMWMRIVRNVSLCVLVVAVIASLLHGASMVSYMQGKLYEDYFLTSASSYSTPLIRSLAGLLPYSLCAYLATMPKRLPATLALLANIATAVPKLMIGTRGAFVLAVVFMAFYYLMRNSTDGKGSWIGRREALVVAIGLPLGVFAMGMVNYLRAIDQIRPEGMLLSLADALYKQGVTFKVLEYGYEVSPQIDALGFRAYTLGSLINAVTQGFVGQLFLGCPLLPDTNSVELAMGSSYYAHVMSFYAHPNYLGGEAYGSAYTLELFTDFGWVGIIAGSLFLGVAFVWLSKRFGRGWFVTVVCLMAAATVFHMPRGEFAEWLSSLWSTRFWICMAGILAVSLVIYLMVRKVRMNSLKESTAKESCND